MAWTWIVGTIEFTGVPIYHWYMNILSLEAIRWTGVDLPICLGCWMYSYIIKNWLNSGTLADNNPEIVLKMVQWNGGCSLGTKTLLAFHDQVNFKDAVIGPWWTQGLLLHGSGKEAFGRRKWRAYLATGWTKKPKAQNHTFINSCVILELELKTLNMNNYE